MCQIDGMYQDSWANLLPIWFWIKQVDWDFPLLINWLAEHVCYELDNTCWIMQINKIWYQLCPICIRQVRTSFPFFTVIRRLGKWIQDCIIPPSLCFPNQPLFQVGGGSGGGRGSAGSGWSRASSCWLLSSLCLIRRRKRQDTIWFASNEPQASSL